MKYKRLVPPDSFIGQYMEYMSSTETAESYDFWCALWAIGTGVGRDVYVDRPRAPVHLNWYIILAAESGTTRKSSAIRSIVEVVDDSTDILGGKTSPEALELILHEASRRNGRATAAFGVSELVTILGREGYMSTMPGLLTDLYDCPEYRSSPGTLKTGEIVQKNVYVTFLSASTPSWLVTAINPSVIEGGFTSRVIFVVDDNRKRSIAWPKSRGEGELEEVQKQYNLCVNGAKNVGAININENGIRKFTSWYNKRTTSNDPFQSSFEAREDDHVLRCAACLSINDGTFEIQSRHISNACEVIAGAKDRASDLFGTRYDTKARIGDCVGRIREILIKSGQHGINHTTLYKRVNHKLDATEFKLLMKVLHESDMIQVFSIQRGGKHYRATKNIENFGIITDVLNKLTD